MTTRSRSFVFASCRSAAILALLVSLGCAGQAWKQTLAEDTSAGYYRFMRAHSDSKHVEAARERLEFHKLKRNPTLAGFDKFRKQYPNSSLLDALHPALEEPAFEAARAEGTAEAFRSFANSFQSGKHWARAVGNATYLEAEGFGGNANALGDFARAHSASDFAAEAQRTAIATAARQGEGIRRVGLVLEIGPQTPERKRVTDALYDRIKELMARAGIEVVPVSGIIGGATTAGVPETRLEVRHDERSMETEVSGQGLSRASQVAVTDVVLREKPQGAVISERRFELRVDDRDYVAGSSILFSSTASKYWDEFFVPTARWRNDQAVRPPIALQGRVVDVAAVGDRAVVLYETGDFDVIGLADPTQPITLSSYRRGETFKRWSGVRLIGSRVVIFGEEGLELVKFGPNGPVAEATWDRGQIGRVLSVAKLGEQLIVGGAKGMQVLELGSGQIRRVMRRVVQGVGSAGNSLVFVDGESVYISSLELLAEGRVIAQMKLGRTFGPNNVRVHDNAAIVTGPGGALIIDVQNPSAPKALAKLASLQLGEIFDATRVRGRTFLIGARGAMLLNRSLQRVEETIDVGSRDRVAVMGRHLVVASSDGVQVVDAAPWASQSMPAAGPAAKANTDEPAKRKDSPKPVREFINEADF